jgi:hypothetical protein
MATEKLTIGTKSVLMTRSDLSELANDAIVLSTAFDTTGACGKVDYVACRVALAIKMAATSDIGGGVSVWFLKSKDDGVTYEDAGTGGTPLRRPDFSTFGPLDTTQRVLYMDLMLTAGKYITLLKNYGTGHAFAEKTIHGGSELSVTPLQISVA